MAHGTNLYYVCKNCKQYKLNPRFSPAPICTSCNKEAEQITKENLKALVNLPLFSELVSNYSWTEYEQNN